MTVSMSETRLSARQVARKIREGRLSAEEVVAERVQHARRVNPLLNALVAERYEAALAEAREVDARRARGGAEDLPEFAGVPCTIKESFALTGMPRCAGLVGRREQRSTEDAVTVQRWRRAGLIPLGVTNTSELCMWMESDNVVYGRTNNPYDPTRIVGGSSGGEGASVAGGIASVGLGSDIGGSIRGPAFFNGVFGHKPTGTLVPSSGQYPIAEGRARRMLCTGPLTQHAEDLMPLLRLLAGPDGRDPVCRDAPLLDPEGVELAGRTLLQVDDNGQLPISEELRIAQEQAARHLVRRGMVLRRLKPKALKHQFEIWSSVLGVASETSFAELLGDGRAISPALELLRWTAGASPHTLPALLLALTEHVPKRFPRHVAQTLTLAEELRREIDGLLGEGGLWLYPSYDAVAPRHGAPVRALLRLKMPFAYLGIMNVLELPVTQVPLGLNRHGLPLGVQVAAPRFADHLTIAAALELERAFGGYVPPVERRRAAG